jgi:hypothetical protein
MFVLRTYLTILLAYLPSSKDQHFPHIVKVKKTVFTHSIGFLFFPLIGPLGKMTSRHTIK